MNIKKQLQEELSLQARQVEATIQLLEEGMTIPFIARYRKEATGGMTDTQLRDFYDRWQYLTSLLKRKEDVKRLIEQQGKWTPELEKALNRASQLNEVEDIYLPFKPKKRTRATIAKEKGLEPLAMLFMLGQAPAEQLASDFVDPQKQIDTVEEAIQGAQDILAETIAEDFELKKELRDAAWSTSLLSTNLKKGAEEIEDYKKFQMYFDYEEAIKSAVPHRILALNRGEKLDILKVKMIFPNQRLEEIVQQNYLANQIHPDPIIQAGNEALKRLILPSLEREFRSILTEEAEERAIAVFGENIGNLLMQSPLEGKVVMGWDPAFRTGCKLAVVDPVGNLLETTTIYPTAPQHNVQQATEIVLDLIDKYQIDIIAIGNGTASRESEQLVADMVKQSDRSTSFVIVSEAGASVYSASQLGADEFPDLNVSLRGAVSIARRLQDPMAELVKIEPKHIGVGQYQHDVNQKRLAMVLDGVVEDTVNRVGIDINTASESLLSYAAGVSKTIAKNIVQYRIDNGPFRNRKQILKVKRLGPAAFEQCAGFLRIADAEEVLDQTGVHPESYQVTKLLLQELGMDLDSIQKTKGKVIQEKKSSIQYADLSKKLNTGIPTLQDIVQELAKPGRDIRKEETTGPILRQDVLKIEDLEIGMELKGTVRNVVDFGAFVDIGIKNDGLVHISELADRYIKNPMEVVAVGDIVKVRVIGVELDRNKVSLTMKKQKNNTKVDS